MRMTQRYLMSAVVLALAVTPAMGQVGIFDQEADWGTVGEVKVDGSATFADDIYTLEGNGNDIWNNQDEGFFIYTEESGSQTLTGEFTFTAPGGNEWAKFGPMIRAEGDNLESVNYFAALRGALDLISPQWRDEAGAASGSFDPRMIDVNGQQVAPVDSTIWLRVTRLPGAGDDSTDIVFSEWSLDGETWGFGNSHQMTLPEAAAYGLAITNHDDNEVLAEGTVSNVALTPFESTVVSRSFDSDSVIEGNSIGVTLSVVANAGAVTLTEIVPEGWTATDISNDGTLDGNTITWELTDADTEVSYTAEVPVGTENTIFSGTAGDVSIIGELQFSILREGINGFDAHADIGAVGAAGSVEALDENTSIVRGSGADIWGTGDQFHYLFSEIEGAFTIKGNLFLYPLGGDATWVKAGFMVRDNLTPGSANVFYGPRTDNQVRWQTRPTQGAESNSGAFLTNDQQMGDVEIHRVGNAFNMYYIDNTTGERTFYDTVTVDMDEPVYVGIAVTSHLNPEISEVEATNVEIIEHPFMISRSVSDLTIAPGESSQIIVDFVPREGEDVSASIEETFPAGFDVAVENTGGEVTEAEGSVAWNLSGASEAQTLAITLTATADSPAIALLEGTFDDGSGYSGGSGENTVTVEHISDYGVFQGSQDVGAVAAPGITSMDGDTWQVIGSGADIWGTADEMHFLYVQVDGDFTFNIDNPYVGGYDVLPSSNDWQKMGLMARQSLDANSAYAYLLVRSSDQTSILQWRDEAGIDAASDGAPEISVVEWNPLAEEVPGNNTSLDDYTPGGTLQLVREGDTFTANYIIDGEVFYMYDHNVVMTDPIYVGVAATSHEDGSYSQARFDNPQLEGETVSVKEWSLY